MATLMPQEIEVWYLLPAVRKELALLFVSTHALPQKKAAELLGLTESAVSQYVKSKRGHELKFSAEDKEKINKTAKLMLADTSKNTHHLYSLCKELRGSKAMCRLHKQLDPSVHKGCSICSQDTL